MSDPSRSPLSVSIAGGAVVPGTVIAGRYRVERVLGAGGMGIVVSAIHVDLEERVAIKLLRPEVLGRQGARERFVREARAAAKIKSEHVVRVTDVAVTNEGIPYIVMEHLDGCDLATLLCAEGRLPVADAASYVRQACEAIARAHALGIVHRDLKPANLFLALAEDGAATVKVLDFGIAKSVRTDSDGRPLTETASVMGSPIYMSPEQLESARDVDGRTDVWSLGIILYELLTGAQPFVADSLPQLCRQIVEKPAPSLRAVRAEVPEALEAIVGKCLAKDRTERYADATALADALRPFADAQAKAPAAVRALSATLGEHAITPSPTTEPPTPKRKRAALAPLAFGAVAVGAVALLAGREKVHGEEPRAASSSARTTVMAPDTILACPPLRARGVDAPNGWLGAGAAALVCERAKVRMGGRSERTLVPAELLDLPREPREDFPVAPYDASDARDRAIAEAARRGTAWVDGDIEYARGELRVSLVLHAKDGRVLARGEGKSATLVDAARVAMQGIEPAIPRAPDGDPFLAEWYRAPNADVAMAMGDVSFSWDTEGPALGAACARLLARTDLAGDARLYYETMCSSTNGEHVKVTLDGDAGPKSPGALVIEAQTAHVADSPATLMRAYGERLGPVADAQTSPSARSIVRLTQAGLVYDGGDSARGRELVLLAIHDDPRVRTMIGDAWRERAFMTQDTTHPDAHMAWVPYSAFAYAAAAMRGKPDEKVAMERRAQIIAPGGFYTRDFGATLLLAGHRDEAATFIAQSGDDGLRLALEASYAHFGTVLERSARMAQATPTTEKGAAAAFSIAAIASETAYVLHRRADVVQEVARRYVLAEPPLLPSSCTAVANVVLACMLAPRDVAEPCIRRIHDLYREGHFGGSFAGIDVIIAGAPAYVRGDMNAAARAWRPISRSAEGWQAKQFATPLADAFQRAGEPDLAAQIDAPVLSDPGRFNGADPAFVRAAQRAAQKGDKETARKLAREVINAWQVADEVPPAVEEMRKLLARLD